MLSNSGGAVADGTGSSRQAAKEAGCTSVLSDTDTETEEVNIVWRAERGQAAAESDRGGK